MSLNSNLEEINELNNELNQLAPKEEWSKQFKESLKNEFTYYSNKIEGTTLPYGETISFLNTGLIRKTSEVPLKDLADLSNHKEVLDGIFESWDKLPLSESNIQDLHGKLMKDPIQWESYEDYYSWKNYADNENKYRKSPIGSHTDTKGGWKWYMDHKDVPKAMTKFTSDLNALMPKMDPKSNNLHPVSIAAFSQNEFTNKIHPFHDGNGRVGRIITSSVLMRGNFPPLIIKDRKTYIDTLVKTKDDNLQPLVNFLSKSLKESLTERIEAVKEFKQDLNPTKQKNSGKGFLKL